MDSEQNTKTVVKQLFKFEQQTTENLLPLFAVRVSAGFPSPADDYIERKLDLNTHLIKHPAATYFMYVEGDSMINAGIRPGDLLIVDRALQPVDNAIVIAHIHGEFTLKRIKRCSNDIYLVPENDLFSPIKITPELECEIWGVVIYVIHKTT